MIFISYSRTPLESALATLLERCLSAAKLEVWRDTTQIQPGERFAEEIEGGIRGAQWMIFLISNSWLDSSWCQNELTLAIKHHGSAARCLPVLRAPSDRIGKRLPVPFKDLNLTTWLEDDPDPAAKLAALYARIAGETLRADQLSERGRALIDAAGAGVLIARPDRGLHVGEDPPSFRCDRAPQWTTVEQLVASGRHDLAVLRGPHGEYHDHFLERVKRSLPDKPDRSIVPVLWEPRPVGKTAYLEALGAGLGVLSPEHPSFQDRLSETLRARLAQQHLLLVHSCLRGDFEDDDVVNYYGVWLPELLAGSRTRFHVKCLQAVAWKQEVLLARLIGWGSGDDDDQRAAEHLVARVEKRQQALTVVRLPELRRISQDELRDFCEAWVPVAHRQPLLDTVRKSRTSEEMLRAIDKYLLRVRQHEQPSAVVETVSR